MDKKTSDKTTAGAKIMAELYLIKNIEEWDELILITRRKDTYTKAIKPDKFPALVIEEFEAAEKEVVGWGSQDKITLRQIKPIQITPLTPKERIMKYSEKKGYTLTWERLVEQYSSLCRGYYISDSEEDIIMNNLELFKKELGE